MIQALWGEEAELKILHRHLYNHLKCNQLKSVKFRDFPGGTVVKNPPANAGDTGSSPGPGRSHMPRSN